MLSKRGSELKVWDTIEVWWQPNRDTIISLEPYNGPIAHIFSNGAQIARFALNKIGMTIDNNEIYQVIDRG